MYVCPLISSAQPLKATAKIYIPLLLKSNACIPLMEKKG